MIIVVSATRTKVAMKNDGRDRCEGDDTMDFLSYSTDTQMRGRCEEGNISSASGDIRGHTVVSGDYELMQQPSKTLLRLLGELFALNASTNASQKSGGSTMASRIFVRN